MSDNNIAPKVVDLFSGCGGLSLGFQKAGFDVVLGVDNWLDALDTFSYNHPNAKTFLGDLSEVSPAEILDNAKQSTLQLDLVVGGPPCQGFSVSGKRLIDDPRNRLYKKFVDFVAFAQPKLFLMENVPHLVAMGKGIFKSEIVEDFKEIGYTVTQQILLASNYGVPQNRKRVFFIGSRDNNVFRFPEPLTTSRITAKQALSDLPNESIEDGSPYLCSPKSEYQEMMRSESNGVYNHTITNHTQKTRDIISLVPDGGNYKDLPEHLRDTRKVNIAWTRLNSQKPSFTIDTGHRHHFHYEYNRVPTVREAARLQSFPDDFIFLGSKTSQHRQVGNAVPPMLAQVIAQHLRQQYGL